MDQFITGDVWATANAVFNPKQTKSACIAYVTTINLNLGKGDILICDASEFSIKFGNTSAKTLEYYHSKGVKVYSNRSLHSKFLLTDKLLVIGSANLSKSSAESLVESAVVTSDDTLISQAKAFYYDLLNDKETIEITKAGIKNLLAIKVIKRPRKPMGKSRTRQKKFGDRYWFISVLPLSERTFKRIEGKVANVSHKVAEKNSLDFYDIGYIRWRKNTVFTDNAKAGDQIVVKWTNASKSRSVVYPPATILKKETEGGFTHFYYDASKEEESISWAKFQKLTKELLGKAVTVRSRTISKEDMDRIKPHWTIK